MIIISAAGMLIGMIIGAGIFALPYSVGKAGVIWGAIHFLMAFFIILNLHILYGRVVCGLPKNRFVGYAKVLLGKKMEKISLINILFSYYGSLLIYAILGGLFLFNIFPSIKSFYWSLMFLAVGSFLVFFDFERIGKLNFYLTIPLIILLILTSLLFLTKINFNNFYELNYFFSPHWFLPYGVFIFSFSGFAALPGISDFLKRKSKNYSFGQLKKIIAVSQIIVALIYFMFIFSALGLFGGEVKENIFSGALETLGEKGIYLMSFAGLLAVLTSFTALSQDFKYIYMIDLKFSLVRSMLFIISPIIVFLFLANQKFVDVMSFIGGLSFGVFGLIVLIMSKKIENQKKEKKGFNGKIIFGGMTIILAVFIALTVLDGFFKFINPSS